MRTCATLSIFMGEDGVDVEVSDLGGATAAVYLNFGNESEFIFFTDHLKKAEALAEALRNCRRDPENG